MAFPWTSDDSHLFDLGCTKVICPLFTLLFLPGLVADGRPEVNGVPRREDAPPRAHEDAQAGLLEDVHVVVVGVPHRPARSVPLGLLALWGVDEAAVAVGPLFPTVVFAYLKTERNT